jgi:hypothetical protein
MKKIKTLILLLILVTLFGSFTGGIVRAIPLSPDKYFFDLKEGVVENKELLIYGKENLTAATKVYIYTLGMRKVGEENDREFYSVNKNDASEVANWVTLGFTELNVKPGSTTTLPWSIKKRGDAKCGTNLAVIVVSTSPESLPTDTSVIGIKNEVVSQIHVNLDQNNGAKCANNRSHLTLEEFKITNDEKIFWGPSVPFLTRLKNDGNIITRQPEGFIEIFGYGSKVSIPFNPDMLDIYPETIRRFDNVWLDPNYPKDGGFFKKLAYEATHLRIGKYEARLGVTKNANPQIIATVTFWIIPWRLLLVILIIFILILSFIYTYIRQRRELKKMKRDSRRL